MRISVLRGLTVAAAVIGLSTGSASAAVTFSRIATIPGTGGPVFGFVRTSDGVLHIVHASSQNGGRGLTADAISPTGVLERRVAALPQTWGVNPPGLVTLPNGSLEAIFGAISPAVPSVSSIWGITSSDGGKTWSAPTNVESGPTLEGLGYNAAITAQMSRSTPVLTVPDAGALVIQQGLGPNTPAATVTGSTDDLATDPDSALDAGTHQVVASWVSLEPTTGGAYLQTVAPTVGTAELVPGEARPYQEIAGRDKGPGVFAPYTTDDKSVRLLRYGGGSLAVGAAGGVTPSAIGVATGIDGRIWAMWGGDNGEIAVTRSNEAVTRWEPIQLFHDKLITLDRLSGDGRLGPLDLLADQVPAVSPQLPMSLYHAYVLPLLNVTAEAEPKPNPRPGMSAQVVTVNVTDAGDAVPGATVTVKGHTQTTDIHGVAEITLPGDHTGVVKLTVTAPNYNVYTASVTL